MRKIRNHLLAVVICLTLVQCTTESGTFNNEYGQNYEAVEELRIGVLDGKEEYIFSRIRDVAFGSEGKIVVADFAIPIIRMYDENGVFLRNVGRSGRGPGEYQMILGMKTFDDGKITVWDPRNLYVHLYAADGEFIESHNVQSSLYGNGVFEAGLDGNFYIRNTLHKPGEDWEFGWLKVSPEGVLTDTIREPQYIADRPRGFILSTATGIHYPFLNDQVTTINKWGEIISGRTTEYKITLHKGDVDSVIINREYEPLEVTPGERDQWESFKRQFGSDIQIPRIKPAFNHITTDSQGRIWVQRYVEASVREAHLGVSSRPNSVLWEKPVFDVFMPDGRFYGTVELPDNARFQDARDDKILAIVTGEMGEAYVSRFRLEPEVDEPEV